MRLFNLNDEEIAHSNDMRALTAAQRDMIRYLARTMANDQRSLEALPENVTKLRQPCPG